MSQSTVLSLKLTDMNKEIVRKNLVRLIWNLLEQKNNYLIGGALQRKWVLIMQLRQFMLVEEFKWYINSDVRAFLNEKEVENLDVAARLANDYSLTHKASFLTNHFLGNQ